jgi:hypothetical protein
MRLTGALVRAFLVVVLVATPSLIMPTVSVDAQQTVSLAALLLAALVFVEYASAYPGLIEFRSAPPFNRIRFVSLLATLIVLSLLVRDGVAPDAITLAVRQIGEAVGRAIDFPYSPVRLMTIALAAQQGPAEIDTIRVAAGLSYLISLVMLAVFVVVLRAFGWPGRGGSFNVWINLPTFDPTAGGDVVTRLERDARINIALGFLLPFLAPVAIQAVATGVAPVSLQAPHMMIWVMAAWSFLPASLFMRGIAMGRIAEMIRQNRARTQAPGAGLVAA